PGLADSRAVLGRDPASVEDRFALAEQEGLLLAGGLLGGKPLQRARVRAAPVADVDLAAVPQRDDQRRAEDGIGGAQAEGERAAFGVGHFLYLDALGVEHDLLRPRRRLDVQSRRSADPLRLEVGPK